MTYPLNTTYDSAVTDLKYTIHNNPLSCWYSLNSGTTNTTITCGANVTGLDSGTGSLTWTVYSNDGLGGENSSSVSFFVSPSGDDEVSPSGGGGSSSSGSVGGGGVSQVPTTRLFSVILETYEQTIKLNKTSFGKLAILNEENFDRGFNIRVETLENVIFFEETNINIPPKESKTIEFKISAINEVGIYPGKIIVTSGSTSKEVLVIINVETEVSLFDIKILIPRYMKVIVPNTNLKAQVDLIQMGLKEKIDVTLNYVIKDFVGNVYLKESETLAVYDQKSIDKEFYTQEFSPNDYVLGVELIYPDGVVVASSQFKIQEKKVLGTKEMMMIALTLIVILVFIVMSVIIKRYKRIIKRLYK
tara:strand:+ start:1 stop:1080 length:1080 start_codon:yes stop_codon:yes gene_type:complete